MATGSFNLTKSANNSSGSYIIGKIEWSSTKNVDGNYSSVTATLYCRKLNDSMTLTSSTGGSWAYVLTVAGSQITGKTSTRILSDWVAIATINVPSVSHNADGTRSINIVGSVTAPTGTSYEGLTTGGSKSVALDTIPRASSVTATNANIGSTTTITINRASSSFTHTLQYSFAGLTGTIATKTESTSVSWTVPTTFYAKIPNAKSGTCTITCTTYNGSAQVGTSTTCTFTVTASESLCKPTLAPTVYDGNSETVAVTGSSAKFVRYFSTALASTGAAARNSATLTSQKITCGTKSSANSSAIFGNVETATFTFSATDSRGYTTTQTINATMVPYVKLTCVLSKASASVDGSIALTVSGSFYNGSFGSKTNALNVYYRYKTTGGSYGSDVKIANVTTNGNTYTATFTVNGLDYQKAYVFQAYATDALMSINSSEQPVRITPIFDWGENDFNFNVPVNFNAGMTVAPVDAAATIDGDGNGKIPLIYIVEQGVSGSWTYRKWNDGTAELWGICKTTHANGSVLGGRLTYPFLLTGTVYAVGTINSAGGNGGAALPWNLKITYGLDLCEAWIHNSGSVGFTESSTIDVSVHIMGRWK